MNPQDFLALNQATPPGYAYLQKPRSSGRGGGLAVIHRADMHIKQLPMPTTASSFESLLFSISGHSRLQVALIYRPPKSSSSDTTNFLSEFSEFLTSVCPSSPSVLLLGDFNIHVDSSTSPFATEFLALLDCFNITQHVRGPTHTKGHTLDLVCSSGTTPTHLQCLDLAVADHHAVLFSVPAPLPSKCGKRSITLRNTKNISAPVLIDMVTSHLSPYPPDTPVDSLVSHYNTALSLSLNALAPLKTRSVSYTSPAPWYTSDLRTMKAAGRRLERLVRRTGLTVHQEAYRAHVQSYKEALTEIRTLYYSSLISDQQDQPRKLFSTINRLLRPIDPPHPPDTDDLCSQFLTFFQTKVDAIHQHLLVSAPPAQPTAQPPCTTRSLPAACRLPSFSPVDTDQVTDLIAKAKPSTCSLDPMPTALVKTAITTLAPIITDILNSSLSSGTYPSYFKTASVTPILKKPGLDPTDLNNYRPISNLPFISKTLERAVANQLQQHMANHGLYDLLQSGFRTNHSTETALLKITNDLLVAADSGHITILILLDLSAAFDSISHTILLTRLSDHLGITDSALLFFQSYLSDRKQFVTHAGKSSSSASVHHGVPQGSVLGPLLFNIYMLPLGDVIRRHGLHFHSYADDTQLYISTKPSGHLPPQSLVDCLRDIETWTAENFLKLNTSKTELLVVAPKSLLHEARNLHLTVGSSAISPSPEVRSLGVVLDSTLSFQAHIKTITKSAFYHLRNISRIRPSLSKSVAEKLIHAFITSRLDYCNGVLSGVPNKTLDRLQYVQNSAARVLTSTKRWDHITPTLFRLHWLPIKSRIDYKVLLHTYKSLQGRAPQYLADLLHSYTPPRTLRSSDSGLLSIPHSRLRSIGDRAFSVAAPTLWNSLPPAIRNATSLDIFKSSLKTHLFNIAYNS